MCWTRSWKLNSYNSSVIEAGMFAANVENAYMEETKQNAREQYYSIVCVFICWHVCTICVTHWNHRPLI